MRTIMRNVGQVALVSLVLAAGVCAAEVCEHSADRSTDMPLDGIERVVIEAKAGTLHIVGDASQKSLSVRAIACAPNKRILNEIQLRTHRTGDTAYVIAELPNQLFSFLAGTNGLQSLDLAISLPEGMRIDVDDSSGEIEIRGVGTTTLCDTSGGLEISDIRGDVTISDGSGSLRLKNIMGDVLIDEDGSGEIHIERVSGNATVDDDGSGGISIEDVQGDVRVNHDGSGGINVRNVGGSFSVDHDGSGGINHRDVAGAVSIDD
jgi:hypothetical protein